MKKSEIITTVTLNLLTVVIVVAVTVLCTNTNNELNKGEAETPLSHLR